MAKPNKNKPKQDQDLPNLGKGVGGAGRVAGFLSEEKAQDTQGTLRRLLSELGSNKWLFFLALILTMLASLAQLFAPRLTGQIINEIVQGLGQSQGIIWANIYQIVLILLVIYVINFLASYISSVTMVRVTQRLVGDLRIRMDQKLNRLPLNYYDRSSSGDMASLLTNDLDNVSNTLQTGLTSSITAIITMIGVFIMMITIEPILAFLTLVIMPLSYYIVRYLIQRAKPIFNRNASLTGQLNGQIEEAFQAEDVVNAYHMEDDLIQEMSKLNEALYDADWKSSFASFMTRPAGDLMVNVNYAIVAVYGGYRVITGALSLGELQAFIQYVGMFRGPFTQVMGIMSTMMSALASSERIYAFLDAEEVSEVGHESLDIEQISGELVFDQVDFGYTDKLLLEGISFKANAGQQFAIVGTTGAGKTTLINLLMRFYEISGGQILLDGKNIQDFKADELRRAYTLVLQDTWLFEGSIRDNIAYGYPIDQGQTLEDVPFEEVVKAAEMARADHFIRQLPDGYDTLLTDGASNISHGQQQLITIARAMIKRAPVTILDEATSSVDTRTEVLIQEGMNELTGQNTSFVIAHRLSTIRQADQILVMDQGDIVEIGNHDHLMQRDGLYAQMVRAGNIVTEE